jgi:ETC complex I subunit conserved region
MAMNVELRRRSTGFSDEAVRAANDNARARPATSGPRVLIYRPAKSAMTSGGAGTRRWVLEFEPQSAPFIEPLMGWTGSTDPLAQVRLAFPTREAAVAYAQRQGLDYEVFDMARPVNTRASVDQRQSQPVALWPIELPSDPNSLLVSEIGTTGLVPNLAA